MLRVLTAPPAHSGPELFDPFAADGRARLRELYAIPRPDWLRMNLIVSVSGSAAGPDGTSETLTNPTDRRILGVIRDLSDVVVVGARSVRAEGYRVPKTAALGIVTTSGDLEGHRIEGDAAGRILVFGPERARDRVAATLPGARFVALPAGPHGAIAPGAILDAARGLGHRSIVCEGGPSLAAQFASAGLIDEVCLTTSPQLTPTALPSLGASEFEPLGLRLGCLLIDDETALYSRWFTSEPAAA